MAATSAADIPAVQKEISKLLPAATVTTSSDLASEVSGSLANAASLASDLGKWLAIAAFVVASLLTMGRGGPAGTRARHAQGARLAKQADHRPDHGLVDCHRRSHGRRPRVRRRRPRRRYRAKADATVPPSPGSGNTNTVAVHFAAHVSVSAIVLAVVLAIAGALIAGSFGGWRVGRLRPADAMAQVG